MLHITERLDRRAATPPVHLVQNYRPSQPHGWPGTPGQTGATVGGHIAAKDFTHKGKSYRIGLLPFGQPGDSPHPVYLDVPSDPDIAFKQTLAEAFGTHYSFRYTGGFRGRREFDVQSYSVFAEGGPASPMLGYGADLYVVYTPDLRRGDPAVHDTLRWIQVVKRLGPSASAKSQVDNAGRPNPFYVHGGRISIFGDRVFNVAYKNAPDRLQGPPPDDSALAGVGFKAELFLAQDTGRKNAAGKTVVNVFGGIKHGWQVQEQRP
ncbi:hypothetical protein SAMN05421505_14039 [Sinosporangium album]|uniref:Uncharacterized protein n=1 Tax=Sinosporangium album TaxID=504805 RepID=A0A1G8J1K7_9ACTN|nr:hypothetical protein [Sinosporangium album]SDI24847.1 hypothetical protein SAMN05421505_14039 [Sinosporangium album]